MEELAVVMSFEYLKIIGAYTVMFASWEFVKGFI